MDGFELVLLELLVQVKHFEEFLRLLLYLFHLMRTSAGFLAVRVLVLIVMFMELVRMTMTVTTILLLILLSILFFLEYEHRVSELPECLHSMRVCQMLSPRRDHDLFEELVA